MLEAADVKLIVAKSGAAQQEGLAS